MKIITMAEVDVDLDQLSQLAGQPSASTLAWLLTRLRDCVGAELAHQTEGYESVIKVGEVKALVDLNRQ